MSKENKIVAVVFGVAVLALVVWGSMRIQDLEQRLDAATDAIHVMNFSAREHNFVVCVERPRRLGGDYYDHPCNPILTFEESRRLKTWMAEAGIG